MNEVEAEEDVYENGNSRRGEETWVLRKAEKHLLLRTERAMMRMMSGVRFRDKESSTELSSKDGCRSILWGCRDWGDKEMQLGKQKKLEYFTWNLYFQRSEERYEKPKTGGGVKGVESTELHGLLSTVVLTSSCSNSVTSQSNCSSTCSRFHTSMKTRATV